jgi:single-strand DNA-binding protein
MANFNKVLLMGNLTRDPELRYTPKGTAVATIGVAVNRRWKDESGQQREDTTFVDVDAFGRTAETIGQYLKKGRPIFIEGRLRYQTWEDKQSGQKRSKLSVVLENFQFMDSQRGGDSGMEAPRSRPAGAMESADTPPPEDDDVPF